MPSANARAARIGPTVCELEGPIPIENRSRAETNAVTPLGYAAARAGIRRRIAGSCVGCRRVHVSGEVPTRGRVPSSSARCLAARDEARVEAEQVEATVEAGVLDLDAAVHDDREALCLAGVGRLLVPDAELHPDRPDAG